MHGSCRDYLTACFRLALSFTFTGVIFLQLLTILLPLRILLLLHNKTVTDPVIGVESASIDFQLFAYHVFLP